MAWESLGKNTKAVGADKREMETGRGVTGVRGMLPTDLGIKAPDKLKEELLKRAKKGSLA